LLRFFLFPFHFVATEFFLVNKAIQYLAAGGLVTQKSREQQSTGHTHISRRPLDQTAAITAWSFPGILSSARG